MDSGLANRATNDKNNHANHHLLYVGSDPIPRDVFLGIKLLTCFPRGYLVLIGIRGIFELLKQAISPCPKMYRLLWDEYEYQHYIKNPNTAVVLLLRPMSPEMQ